MNLIKASLVLAIIFSSQAQAQGMSSFSKSKKVLYSKIYPGSGKTIYTNCHWYKTHGNKKIIDLESCGLQNAFPKRQMKRAKRVEAEHVIPASWGYKNNGFWRSCAIDKNRPRGVSRRKYCQDVDPGFKKLHNDLIGLFPSVGQINADRSNKPYSSVKNGSKPHTFRGNGKEITITSRVAVPPKEMRGDIARIAFFYQKEYGVTMNQRQKSDYLAWDKADPISSEEIARNNRIKKAQGWGNYFVSR